MIFIEVDPQRIWIIGRSIKMIVLFHNLQDVGIFQKRFIYDLRLGGLFMSSYETLNQLEAN